MAQLEPWRDYVSHFETTPADDVWPRRQAAVAHISGRARRMSTMQWGVPLTMKGKRPGTTVTKRITNVRNLSSPFWKSMLSAPENRCLVPFAKFAEPKPNAGREEIWFTVNEEEISAFAGIWRDTEEGPAFAFLTCEPNPLVKPIHPKAMPVILHPNDYDRWLAGEAAAQFQSPFPSQLMRALETD